jgi:peptide deformylase
MSVRPILVVPHEILALKAEEIRNIDDRIVKLAADMIETMYVAPGLGLAANQVGEPIQLVVIDVEWAHAEPKHRKKNPIVIMNPTITYSEGEWDKEEGCLSVPEFFVEVRRAEKVEIVGVDPDGNPISIGAEGMMARVLQHEIDHLEGTTLLDRASALKRNLYRRKIRKRVRRDQ